MRRRPLALGALLALAACSRGGGAPEVADGGEHVACAIGDGAQFAEACAVERTVQDGKAVLVVRHPDGGFRRFIVEPDGLALADGAGVAKVAAVGGLLDVSVEHDRYRIPFAVKSDGAR
ncbi:hypothetical protein H7F51_12145 [Novosphingobium flavum]|uniref:Lipoprotein n=1 Tax=Novosphingobium flavum TaxID=1778672 RepID=A0A7X1KMF8_9SPHN|nr:hypothetical protein [Novosphingobium flavum]MBC2666270.1 hypothetical protein [Novosphingobium flavum]